MPSGLVNSVIIIVRANMAAGTRRINKSILLTNHKLPSIHSESVSRSRSKGRTYSFVEKTAKMETIVHCKVAKRSRPISQSNPKQIR